MTVRDTARRFARAIVMPNLRPPVSTTAQALEYRQHILDAVPAGLRFNPLMTLYLTDDTPPSEIVAYWDAGATHAGIERLKGVRDNCSDERKIYDFLSSAPEWVFGYDR